MADFHGHLGNNSHAFQLRNVACPYVLNQIVSLSVRKTAADLRFSFVHEGASAAELSLAAEVAAGNTTSALTPSRDETEVCHGYDGSY